MLLVPLGGGGLLSGSALAVRALAPQCKLYGVEPEAGNDGQQSLRKGEIVHIATPNTIADGAQTQHLGRFTFEVIRRDVDDILTASDAQLVEAMRFFAERMKIVVEPTGCLGFAAACHAGLPLEGKRVGVILSGGNVDLARFAQLIGSAASGLRRAFSSQPCQPKPIHLHGKPLGSGRFPAICAPLVGRTREQLLAEAALVAAKKPDLLEWRVDFFEGIADTAAGRRSSRRASSRLPAACRCSSRGAPAAKAAKRSRSPNSR